MDPHVSGADVRDDFVPKDAYLDPAFVKMEGEKLWPRVWQVAGREEEIPHEGDYITYDVANEGLIVMRTADGSIKAFHNACPHRGRRLLNDQGHLTEIVCGFHAWRFNLDGANTHVVDRGDWGECLKDGDVDLKHALVETWGGFIWINMDLQAEPLEQFLAPMNARCGPYEFEKMRFRWYKTVTLPCNWKVAIEAFNEAYHVQGTHPQILEYTEDYTNSAAFGRHGSFWYPVISDSGLSMQRSSRVGGPQHTDYRQYVLEFAEEFNENLKAMLTPRAYEATQRLRAEVAADASQLEVLTKWAQFMREAAIADGAGWPDLTYEQMEQSNVDWHVFPNTVFLHSLVDGLLWYRTRPNGDDPDSCVFDVWSLVRYAPGQEPPLVREVYKDWKDAEWGRILFQDFRNMEQMQRGMKSMGFAGSRTNPVQEQPVSNFHRALREFLSDAPGPSAKLRAAE